MKARLRILFLLFIFALGFVFLSLSGYAAENTYFAEAENGSAEYFDTYSSAVEFLEGKGKITLKQNTVTDTTLTLPDGIIFDLGGYTLTASTTNELFCFAGGSLQGFGNIITSGPLASNSNFNSIDISGSHYGIHVFTDATQIFNMGGGELSLSLTEITATNIDFSFATGADTVNLRNFVLNGSGGQAFSGKSSEIIISDSSLCGLNNFLLGDSESATQITLTDTVISANSYIFNSSPLTLIRATDCHMEIVGDEALAGAIFYGVDAEVNGGVLLKGLGSVNINSSVTVSDSVSYEKADDNGAIYVAGVNGKYFKDINLAFSYADTKDSYVKLESDVIFTPDEYLSCAVYTNGFKFESGEYSTSRNLTVTALSSTENPLGYLISVPLFALVHSDGTYSHYYEEKEFDAISSNYVSQSKNIIYDNDTLILYGNITLNKSFEIERSPLNYTLPMNLTFDINGNTFTSTAEQAFIAGNDSSNRFYAHMHIIFKSSTSGGIINVNKDGCLLSAFGKNKNLTVLGENLTVNTDRLFIGTNGSQYASGGSVRLIGGIYNQSSPNSFIFNNRGEYNRKIYIFSTDVEISGNAEINLCNGGELIGVNDTSNKATYTDVEYTINNARINLNGATLTDFTKYVTDKSTLVIDSGANINGNIPTSGNAKIILKRGAVFSSVTDEISSFAESLGTYFGSDGLELVKYNYTETESNQQYAVAAAADIKKVKYTDAEGSTLSSYDNYYINAELPQPNYSAPPHNCVTMELLHSGWNYSTSGEGPITITYSPKYTVQPKNPIIELSASIHDRLSVNIYLHNSFYEYLIEEEKSNYNEEISSESSTPEYHVIKRELPINRTFGKAEFIMTFSENFGGIDYEWTHTVSYSIYEYARRTMEHNLPDSARYLIYHLLEYVKSSYQVVRIPTNERDAISQIYGSSAYSEALARLAVKNIIDNTQSEITAATGFEASNPFAGNLVFYRGNKLGVKIAVDLHSSPVFIISPVNSLIATVKINGNPITRSNDGCYVYAPESLLSFDESFVISTYDSAGNRISEGTFCYANYVAAVSVSGNADLKRTVYDLHSFILAAKAYKEDYETN